MEVLEVGCGIGDTACYFAQEVFPDGHVTAFDVAEELLAFGPEQAKSRNIQNISFICTDAFDFDYSPEQYDLIHARCVLKHLSDPTFIVSKLFEALKPSGWLFVEEEYTPVRGTDTECWQKRFAIWIWLLVRAAGGHPYYTRHRLPASMESIGFRNIRAENYVFTPNQKKYFEMIYLALSKELRSGLLEKGIASEQQIEDLQDIFQNVDTSMSQQALNIPQVFGRKP
ncbi:hypothetical protein GCM10007094_07910 [Pseudovibrio japonicus]|uniref:Methyltransferase domain-containing protein n=2 Tax=Pseudovibrio japonicus TaxID=366534 RepID=A0ABQ3E0B4_9HYPH|nr:hypothetical protein GCM10007094_07910 [Pseudovibrio japonicus]